jgi:hypothetical protein
MRKVFRFDFVSNTFFAFRWNVVTLLILLSQAFVFEVEESDLRNTIFGVLIAIVLTGTFIFNVLSLMRKMLKKSDLIEIFETDQEKMKSKDTWRLLLWMNSFLKVESGNLIVLEQCMLERYLSPSQLSDLKAALENDTEGDLVTNFTEKNRLGEALRIISSRANSSSEALELMLSDFLNSATEKTSSVTFQSPTLIQGAHMAK